MQIIQQLKFFQTFCVLSDLRESYFGNVISFYMNTSHEKVDRGNFETYQENEYVEKCLFS